MTSPTIEKMRAEEAEQAKRLQLEDVRAVVDGLADGQFLCDIATESGLDEATILEIVAEFGTWLTHVRGGAKVAIVQPYETGRLFSVNDLDATVVIPPGFERTAGHGRDVGKSLAAIVVSQPDDDLILRWLARKYPPDTAVLTFPHITTVWKFAELGRLEEIDEVSPHPTFRKLTVEAYDLLDQAVEAANEAVAALRELADANEATLASSLDTLDDVATKLSWLQPREMRRLRQLVSVARDDTDALRTLRSRLSTLRRLIHDDPSWRLEDVGSLNEGHVQQIARLAGISVDGVSRSEEAEIRTRLAELGLKADADRLVPEGVRAKLAGVDDKFWEAMEVRASGDPGWRTILSDAYADA